jgi:Mg-chelatase subunit ChlD
MSTDASTTPLRQPKRRCAESPLAEEQQIAFVSTQGELIMYVKLTGIGLVALTAAIVASYPSFKSDATTTTSPPAGVIQARQKIEVVFVLDTTSSMTGLIETAKEKIWSIAATMAQARQAPEIRMGLVAFRDRGDDYVTRMFDLTNDLDAMYTKLMGFAAVGGGDGPESVNAALATAIDKISWSQDPSSYRVVFLVGDAPPHMDYQDERQYPEIVRAAVAKGIIVNTIQCGDVPATAEPWRQIARLGNGRYLDVGQTGDAFAVSTPYDEELAELSARLDGTRVFYGTADKLDRLFERSAQAEEIVVAASTASQARRAAFNATESGAASYFGEDDLIEDIASGEIALEDVPAEHLPQSLRALDATAREAEVTGVLERRRELQSEIGRLSEARERYIADEIEEAGGAAGSLDQKIFDVVREQGASVGLSYDDGAKF